MMKMSAKTSGGKEFIIVEDDRPYEQRSREEIMDSETIQMIRSMNNNRWD